MRWNSELKTPEHLGHSNIVSDPPKQSGSWFKQCITPEFNLIEDVGHSLHWITIILTAGIQAE